MLDTQSKFSGGEWYLSNSTKHANAIDVFANPEKLAVGVGVCEVFGDNFQANARLIRLAPKLWHELEAIINLIDQQRIEDEATGEIHDPACEICKRVDAARGILEQARGA